jgi:hypothetical protein
MRVHNAADRRNIAGTVLSATACQQLLPEAPRSKRPDVARYRDFFVA